MPNGNMLKKILIYNFMMSLDVFNTDRYIRKEDIQLWCLIAGLLNEFYQYILHYAR